ncbi:DegT/DnrJ/EryC1/StrS family aminotransferase [Paenibacillus sp. 8b26]|uniref:DegT/DnrJ/EryC1/StrS family aminotransferase n=1 Tax=Paenibacillus sp. 8b26 TaxID=3424133 RepID=UPI003D66069C
MGITRTGAEYNDMRHISIAKPSIGTEEIEAVTRVLESGQLAQGETVYQFEREFSEHFGYTGSAAVANGTAALHVALLAAGVKPGDKVLTTPFTFVATSNAILYCNAVPVFVDVDEASFNISPEAIRKAANDFPEARYLLLVHLFGQSCEMDKIAEVAKEFNLTIIEDCAQAHGATYQSKPVGTFGCGGTFSFYPTKNMSTGEGGMIVSQDTQFLDTSKLLINHGSKQRYVHEVLGYNYRMTNIAAAIGIEQLKKIDQMNSARRKNAEYYFSNIHNNLVTLPFVHEYSHHVFHQFTITTTYRDQLVSYLTEKGIGTGIHYQLPVHKQLHIKEYLASVKQKQYSCPTADKLSEQVLSIPVNPALSMEDLEYVVQTINNFSV